MFSSCNCTFLPLLAPSHQKLFVTVISIINFCKIMPKRLVGQNKISRLLALQILLVYYFYENILNRK